MLWGLPGIERRQAEWLRMRRRRLERNGTGQDRGCQEPTKTQTHNHIIQCYHFPDRKKSLTFLDESSGNMSYKCTFINQILSEHHVSSCDCVLAYQFCYQHFVEPTQSDFPNYTNFLTFT